jgi:hypothetical protein
MNFSAPLLALLTCGFGVVSVGAFTLNRRDVGVVFGILFLVVAALSVVNILLTAGRPSEPEEAALTGSDLPVEDHYIGHPSRGYDDVGA